MIFEKNQYQEKQCNVRRNNSYKERVRLYMVSFCSILFTQYLIDVFRKKSDKSEVEEENKVRTISKVCFYN